MVGTDEVDGAAAEVDTLVARMCASVSCCVVVLMLMLMLKEEEEEMVLGPLPFGTSCKERETWPAAVPSKVS